MSFVNRFFDTFRQPPSLEFKIIDQVLIILKRLFASTFQRFTIIFW